MTAEKGYLVQNHMCPLCLHTAMVVMPENLVGKPVECSKCGEMRVPVIIGEESDFEARH